MPADGEMLDDGTMPADGEILDDGTMPADGEMPDDGMTLEDGEMPAEGDGNFRQSDGRRYGLGGSSRNGGEQ